MKLLGSNLGVAVSLSCCSLALLAPGAEAAGVDQAMLAAPTAPSLSSISSKAPDQAGYVEILKGWRVEGSTAALAELAKLYWTGAYGMGIERDRSQALSMLREAAGRGDAEAARFLGDLQWYGKDVQKDMRSAMGWYEASARSGSSQAAFILGQIYEEGKAGKIDIKKALFFYTAAANAPAHPSVEAQAKLGYWYLIGYKSVKSNTDVGLRYLTSAAEDGSIQAKYNYAVAVLSIKPSGYSSEKALAWLKEAADSGHKNAAYLLANFYVSGKHVGKDLSLAAKYAGVAKGLPKAEQLNASLNQVVASRDRQRVSLLDAILGDISARNLQRRSRADERRIAVRYVSLLSEQGRAARAGKRAASKRAETIAANTLKKMLAEKEANHVDASGKVNQRITSLLHENSVKQSKTSENVRLAAKSFTTDPDFDAKVTAVHLVNLLVTRQAADSKARKAAAEKHNTVSAKKVDSTTDKPEHSLASKEDDQRSIKTLEAIAPKFDRSEVVVGESVALKGKDASYSSESGAGAESTVTVDSYSAPPDGDLGALSFYKNVGAFIFNWTVNSVFGLWGQGQAFASGLISGDEGPGASLSTKDTAAAGRGKAARGSDGKLSLSQNWKARHARRVCLVRRVVSTTPTFYYS